MNQPRLRQMATVYWPWALVVLFMALGAFLRLYRQPELAIFLGDQGRDSTIVRQIIETHQPVLLGPSSYYGGFYRGPAWYYFLLVPFWLGGENPGAGVAMVALMDVAAIALLFVVGRALFHPWVGLVASALWCCNNWTIDYARYMWNPSPLPFFVLIVLYCLFRLARGNQRFLLLLVPVWTIGWQFHDSMLLLLPLFAGFWILYRPKIKPVTYAAALGLALLMLTPFLVYETQNGFPNTTAMVSYGLHLPTAKAVGVSGPGAAGRVVEATGLLDGLLPPIDKDDGAFPQHGPVHFVFEGVTLLGIVALIRRLRQPGGRNGRIFLLYLLSLLLFAAWPGPVARAYILPFFPVPFLLVGLGFDLLRAYQGEQSRRIAAAAWLVLAAFVAYSFTDRLVWFREASPFTGSYGVTSGVVDYILADAQGQPFTFQLISPLEQTEAFDLPYVYLFTLRGHPPSDGTELYTYVVYDPEEYGEGRGAGGRLIYRDRVVSHKLHAVGSNLLANPGWQTDAGGQIANWEVSDPEATRVEASPEGRALVLTGTEMGNELNVTQDLKVSPSERLLIRFNYRNMLSAGDQRIYFQVADRQGSVIATLPEVSWHAAEASASWKEGSIILTVPPGGVQATLRLWNRGIGEAWFRNLQIEQVVAEPSN